MNIRSIECTIVHHTKRLFAGLSRVRRLRLGQAVRLSVGQTVISALMSDMTSAL